MGKKCVVLLKCSKKITALILTAIIFSTMLPVQALEAQIEDEQQLRQALREAVDETEYPNGLFEFLATRMNTSENLSYVEIAVVRKGGTEGEASVTIKAIDVTAKYGEDYTLSVPHVVYSETLPANENGKTLMDSLVNEPGEEDGYAGWEDAFSAPQGDDAETPPADEDGNTLPESPESDAGEGDEIILSKDTEIKTGSGLRAARDAALGQTSNRKNWREINESEKEAALDLHNELYEGLEGVTYTFRFADGEYMKKLRFNTIDDNISEDEEQVLFALIDAEGSVIGESRNAFMNIEDNEEKELVRFEMEAAEVQAEPSRSYVEVAVKRTAGLYRYGLVTVSTAAVTAEPGVDYDPIVTELRFVPGQELQTVRVPLLKENPQEGLQFYVRLDPESPNLSEDGPTQTLVTIASGGKTMPVRSAARPLNGAQIDAGTLSDTGALSGSDAGTGLLSSIGSATAEGVNYKTKTLYPFNLSGGKNYVTINGPYGWTHVPITGQKNYWNYIYFNADLSMVERIQIDWSNTSNGTEYRGWGWLSSVFYTDFYSRVYLGNDPNNWKKQRDGKFNSVYDWIDLNDNDRRQGTINFATFTMGDCADSELNVGYITLYYKPIKVTLRLNTEDPDARVVHKTWTSATSSTDGTSRLVGKLAFAGDTTTATSKTFFDGDTVQLAPSWDPACPDTSKLYLWGYKIERIGANGFYYEGTSLNIRDVYTGNMRDSITGEKILRDQIMFSGGTEIVLHPVYRQKTAFVRINYDPAKGGMDQNRFQNGEVLKVGMLDTIEFNAYAKTGYSVSGYGHGNINFNDREVSSAADEWHLESLDMQAGRATLADYLRALNGTTGTIDNSLPHARYIKPVSGITINPALPGILSFQPEKSFTDLTVQYSTPYLKVMVDPTSGDQDKGSIFYHPEEGADLVGNSQTPLIISPIERGKSYNITGVPAEGYRVVWKDFTGDINEDGIRTEAEKLALGPSFEDQFNDKVVNGSILGYKVTYDRPLIYYSFEPKPTQGTAGLVFGQVVLAGGTVLQNSGEGNARKDVTVPLRGAQVIINGHQTATDDSGRFELRDKDFTTNEYHSLIVHYKGNDYIGYIGVNDWKQIKINAYEDFVPYNFKGYEVEQTSGTEGPLETLKPLADLKAIENKDATLAFQFMVKSNQPGLAAGSAVIRLYNKAGDQKGSEITVEPQDGLFTFRLNPAAANIVPGDTMTLQILDQNGKAGIEHPVGLGFIKHLDSFSLLTSFRSPASDFIETVGAIDTAFDLGLAGKTDKYMQKSSEEWVIAFGFNKNWEKSLLDGSGKKEELKDAAKSTDSDKTKKTTDEAVDKNNEEKKGASLTADMKFGLSTSLYLRMKVNKDPTSEYYGYAYFDEMILSATVSGSFSTKVEIQTPIGVTVFVGLELGGDITAMMVIEKYQDHYKYFDANGEIDFSNADDDNPNRDFTIYGKFMVRPYIAITVGAKIPLAEVSIEGRADFDLNFTTLGTGHGSVTLTSRLSLTVIGINFEWNLANVT